MNSPNWMDAEFRLEVGETILPKRAAVTTLQRRVSMLIIREHVGFEKPNWVIKTSAEEGALAKMGRELSDRA